MAKLIVEIDVGDCSRCPIVPNSDWFPTADKTLISVDEAMLECDPLDDSFFQFKLIEIKES